MMMSNKSIPLRASAAFVSAIASIPSLQFTGRPAATAAKRSLPSWSTTTTTAATTTTSFRYNRFFPLCHAAPCHRFFHRSSVVRSSSSPPSSSSLSSSSSFVRPRLTIFFGSQTGHALSLAHQLRKYASKDTALQWDARVVDLAQMAPATSPKQGDMTATVTADNLHEHLTSEKAGLCCFITACFGEGEATDNAKPFVAWLSSPERDKDPNLLSSTHFSIFGLGQSVHFPTRYQAVSKLIERRLRELGAHAVCERGEGDDAKDMEADWEKWMEELLAKMKQMKEENEGEFRRITASTASPSSPSSGAKVITTPPLKPTTTTPPTATPTPTTTQAPSTIQPSQPTDTPTWLSMFGSATTTAATTSVPSTSSFVAASITETPTTTATIATTSTSSCAPSSSSVSTLYNVRHPFNARVVLTRELHNSLQSTHSCVQLRFDTSDAAPTPSSSSPSFSSSHSTTDHQLQHQHHPHPLSYSCGDYLGVWPKNSHHTVKKLSKRLSLPLAQRVEYDDFPLLQTNKEVVRLGEKRNRNNGNGSGSDDNDNDAAADDTAVSVATVLSRFADLSCPPPRSTLRALSKFASHPVERSTLAMLSESSELARSDYASFVVGQGRTFIDVLNAFPSIQRIPIPELIELLPSMTHRFYSISSSPYDSTPCEHSPYDYAHSSSLLPPSLLASCSTPAIVDSDASSSSISPAHLIDITVGLVEYTPGWTTDTLTGMGRDRLTEQSRTGLCSGYLRERQCGDYVPVFVKQSLFRLPVELERPIIMFGAGTGIAPFRGFIQERIAHSRSCGVHSGTNVLFYGCCHEAVDLLYCDELRRAVHDGHLQLRTAFSHQYAYRRFVQHVILEPENRQLIWRLMNNEGANVYVCGSLKRLAPAVQEAMQMIVMSEGGKSKDAAAEYLKQLQAQHRMQLDVF